MSPDLRKNLNVAFGVSLLALSGVFGAWIAGYDADEVQRSWRRFETAYGSASVDRMVRKDDFCGMARLAEGNQIPTPAAVAAVFDIPANDASGAVADGSLRSLVESLLAPRAEVALEGLSSLRTEAADFYRALILAGWIEPLRPEKLDLNGALEILRDLKVRDPSNGALGVFEAALLQRMGARAGEVLQLLAQAFATQKLDTYFPSVSRALLLRAASNSTGFLVGTELQERLPAPALEPLWKDLLPLISQHGSSRIIEAAVKFSRGTLRQARLQRPDPEGWSSALATARQSSTSRCERRDADQLIKAETRLFRRQLASAEKL
jgi:hypothetical protein